MKCKLFQSTMTLLSHDYANLLLLRLLRSSVHRSGCPVPLRILLRRGAILRTLHRHRDEDLQSRSDRILLMGLPRSRDDSTSECREGWRCDCRGGRQSCEEVQERMLESLDESWRD